MTRIRVTVKDRVMGRVLRLGARVRVWGGERVGIMAELRAFH